MTDYFDFFGLPTAPTVDQAELKRRYYANSKKYHPDFHTLEDPSRQQEVLEKSTQNNQGYKVLADDDQRLRHLLEVKGVMGAEGTNEVPQDFLMEIMEVNEALMELEFEDDPEARQRVTTLINELESELDRSVQSVTENYDDTSAGKSELTALKDYYLKRRYLLRLREKL